MAWQPSKYGKQYEVDVSPGVRLAVRFDTETGRISRFVTQLQWFQWTNWDSGVWKTLAQIDHEPGNPMGHDLYDEGLHIDIYYRDGGKTTIKPRQPSRLHRPVGVLLRASKEYLETNESYFDQVSKRHISLSSPPQYR